MNKNFEISMSYFLCQLHILYFQSNYVMKCQPTKDINHYYETYYPEIFLLCKNVDYTQMP